ncbi:phosphotransferase [Trichophyton rubrum]|uniref:Phosphotransferase n=1 Tax=Trichophyton rubrum TaxID=5551 RepID=A0A178EZU7_TRIRU|nr:phosphotransferase [Trichophyton rubrum]
MCLSTTSRDASSAEPESFFRNTSRRWICNEDARFQEHYVKFNITELQHKAVETVNRPYCSQIIKMAEGGFNKVFLLTMDDGSEVVARIPTPIAGPRGLTTASEVATMRFLRETLHIPVPRVLTYSPTSDNPIARIEKKIFNFKFPAYGSLYHGHDIPKESRVDFEVDGGDFCIGPICKRQFWHGERADMELDRGPWTSPADCVSAPARRELACTSTFGKPRPRRAFLLPTEENIDPREHISLLSQYLQVAPFPVPAQQEMATPILRHPDLSFPNILLTPGTNKIEGILDWQDASILPLFMQAGYPAFCEHNYSQVQSLKEPNLPDNYGELNDVDRMKTDIKLQLEKANLYYYAATGLGMIQYLISHAGYPWDADLINFRAGLVGLTKIWDGLISDPCPISFSPDDDKAILNDATEWRECEEILLNIQENIGVDREGGTHPDDFEHVYEMAQRLRLQIYANAEEKLRKLFWKSWIFKDDAEPSRKEEDIIKVVNAEMLR